VPGYTINPDGGIIPDELIVSALKYYRSQKEFSNGGGYQKLTWYLRRDFNYIVNSKKISALPGKQFAFTLKNLRVMSEANYNKLNGKITSKNSP